MHFVEPEESRGVEFGRVGVDVANDGFVAVLKNMPCLPMLEVVSQGVAGPKPPHEIRQTHCPAAKQEMRVIAHQRPGIDRCAGSRSQDSEPPHKICAGGLVIDNRPLFNATNHQS